MLLSELTVPWVLVPWGVGLATPGVSSTSRRSQGDWTVCPLPEAVSRPHVSSLPTSPALASPPRGSGSDASRGPGAGTPRSPLSLSFPVCRAGPAVAPVPPGARAAGDLAQALLSHPRSARSPERTRCRAPSLSRLGPEGVAGSLLLLPPDAPLGTESALGPGTRPAGCREAPGAAPAGKLCP